jgi:predicted acetyltransferase
VRYVDRNFLSKIKGLTKVGQLVLIAYKSNKPLSVADLSESIDSSQQSAYSYLTRKEELFEVSVVDNLKHYTLSARGQGYAERLMAQL